VNRFRSSGCILFGDSVGFGEIPLSSITEVVVAFGPLNASEYTLHANAKTPQIETSLLDMTDSFKFKKLTKEPKNGSTLQKGQPKKSL
jgi:hypothetical protein